MMPAELMRFLDTHPPGRALDIGCGTGTNAITLAEHGWQVTGIDFSFQAIAKARRKARRRSLSIDFIQGQVTVLDDLTGPFDLCLDIGCYHSLPMASHEDLILRLGDLLRPGGTYLLYTFRIFYIPCFRNCACIKPFFKKLASKRTIPYKGPLAQCFYKGRHYLSFIFLFKKFGQEFFYLFI